MLFCSISNPCTTQMPAAALLIEKGQSQLPLQIFLVASGGMEVYSRGGTRHRAYLNIRGIPMWLLRVAHGCASIILCLPPLAFCSVAPLQMGSCNQLQLAMFPCLCPAGCPGLTRVALIMVNLLLSA